MILTTCLVVLLALGLVPGAQATPTLTSPCVFPGFVLSRPRWEKNIAEERRKTGKIVKFTATGLTITDLTSSLPKETKHEIVKCVDEDKYIINEAGQEKYVCLSLIRRSGHVFQWKLSNVSDNPDEALCSDDNLILDKWPFVWPFLDSESYETSPVQGGFSIQIYDNAIGKYICSNYWTPPILESECVKGDGMKVNFRHFDCLGNIHMNLLQTLYSLGTWREGNYEYSVVINENDLWPNMWMLRFSLNARSSSKFDIDVFTVIATVDGIEPSVVHKFYTWSLTKLVNDDADCADSEELPCEGIDLSELPCSSTQLRLCQKSCGLCSHDRKDDVDHCPFIDEYQGSWEAEELNGRDKKKLAIGGISVNISSGFPHFKCYNASDKKWIIQSNRKPLKVEYNNGCQPRYVCLELQKPSRDVLTYRFSNTEKGHQTVDTVRLCSNENFGSMGSNMFFRNEHRFRSHVLARTDKSAQKTDETNCGPERNIYLSPMNKLSKPTVIVVSKSGNNTVILNSTCLPPNTSDSVVYTSITTTKWFCLSRYTQITTDVLIVKAEDMTTKPRVQCWLTHRNMWSTNTQFYAVPLSRCHADTPNLIETGKVNDYLAVYTITDNSTCEFKISPTVTPIAQTTTSKLLSTTSRYYQSSTDTVPKSSTQNTPNKLVTQNIPSSSNDSAVYQVKTQQSTSTSSCTACSYELLLVLLIMLYFYE